MTEREIEEMAADGVLREPMLLRYVAQWYRDPDKRLGPALTGTFEAYGWSDAMDAYDRHLRTLSFPADIPRHERVNWWLGLISIEIDDRRSIFDEG